jgi:hypothetical protein
MRKKIILILLFIAQIGFSQYKTNGIDLNEEGISVPSNDSWTFRALFDTSPLHNASRYFVIAGVAGQKMSINWGDGTSEVITFTGADQNITEKSYAAAGTYTITFMNVNYLTKIKLNNYANAVLSVNSLPKNLTYLWLGDMPSNYVTGNSLPKNLTYLYLSGLGVNLLYSSWSFIYLRSMLIYMNYSQSIIDKILCDINVAYPTGTGTLDLRYNSSPSATGIACKDNLVARGWTVTLP